MSLADLRPLVALDEAARGERQIGAVDFDPALTRFARDIGNGQIVVYQVSDRREVLRLPRMNSITTLLLFSPDGRKLAALSGRLRVWNVTANGTDSASSTPLVEAAGPYQWDDGLAFSPDSRQLAAANNEGFVDLFDMDTGKRLSSLPTGGQTRLVSFHPALPRLAAFCHKDSRVRVWDLTTKKVVHQWAVTSDVHSLAWLSDAEELLVGCADSNIYALAGPTGNIQRTLRGHRGPVNRIMVSPSGKTIASHGWDGQTLFWDINSDRPVLKKDGHVIRWARDGERLAWRNGSQLGIGAWEPTTESPVLYQPWHMGPSVERVAFHPRLPLVAGAGSNGIRLWDAANGHAIGWIHRQRSPEISFNPADGSLFAINDGEIRRWPTVVDEAAAPAPTRVKIGPSELLRLPSNIRAHGVAIDRSGRRFVSMARDGRGAIVVEIQDPQSSVGEKPAVRRVGSPISAKVNLIDTIPGRNNVAISPDGKGFRFGGVAAGENRALGGLDARRV
jgi:WD40 repeat protein